jgi:predicted amidophosphoribosyltransferase
LSKKFSGSPEVQKYGKVTGQYNPRKKCLMMRKSRRKTSKKYGIVSNAQKFSIEKKFILDDILETGETSKKINA